MKHIWILNHYATLPEYSISLRHYNFAKYMTASGYVVTIFASSAVHNSEKNFIKDGCDYFEEKKDGINYVFIKSRQYNKNSLRILNILDYTFLLKRVSKRFLHPDFIYASSPHLLTLLAGIKTAKRFHVPCACEIRDLWPLSIVAYNGTTLLKPLIPLLYELEKWIYKKADGLIFTMEGWKEYLKDRGLEKKIDLSKIYHINNGVDFNEYKKNESIELMPDSDLDNPDTFKVVYTGSVRKVNHVGKLLDVAQILQSQGNKKIVLFIYGTGNETDMIRRYIHEKGLNNIILKGFIQKQYIPAILKRADLVLLHNQDNIILKYGTSLNKLFDYFASGKPILADFSSAFNLIERYNAGKIIPNNDALKTAEAIIYFSECSTEKYEQYCNNSLLAAKDYDAPVLTEKLVYVLQSVCEQYKG